MNVLDCFCSLSRSGATKWGRGDATESHILAHVSPNPNRSPGLHFAPRHCESLQRHYIYIYDEACKVLGPEATILAMRPHTPSSSHEFCPLRRWARAPNPVASRLETWQSSWHPYPRRARQISRPFEPKCSRSGRFCAPYSGLADF